MVKEYLAQKVYGLPKGSYAGHKTSKKQKFHLYQVEIAKTVKKKKYVYKYFKVHLKRQNKSKIKYFKTKKAAEIFVESLRLNPYL